MTEIKHWIIVFFGVLFCLFIGWSDNFKVIPNAGPVMEQPIPVAWIETKDSQLDYWLHKR